MFEAVFRAFISSTSKDLSAHRAAVIQTVTRLNGQPKTMEEFGAQAEDATHVSLQEIEGCDVFIGIYAYRYGYRPSGGPSVTEQEYHKAVELGIPCLIFVVDDDAPSGYLGWDSLTAHRETDPESIVLLQHFKDTVGQKWVWDTFTSPADLAQRVSSALSKWIGWQRPEPLHLPMRFVGRTDLLDQLEAVLTVGNRVGLVGIGGIGKTFAAARVSEALGERFAGGVLWTQFGPDAVDPETLLARTMSAWMQHHHPGRLAPAEELKPSLVRMWLNEVPAPLLIVFDDIWHVRAAREMLSLIPPNAALLITSRRADIARQLDVEDIVEITRFSDEDGLTMLRDRVGDMPSPAALRRIVDLVDGHPLALEIVATQIIEHGPDYAEVLPGLLAERLDKKFDFGLLETEGEEKRYASVEAALGLTYENMSHDLRYRYRALGVLAPDSPLPACILSAVWNDPVDNDIGRNDSVDRMNALVSAGVLSKIEDAYIQHGLLRTYARSLSEQAGEIEAFRDRYSSYVIENLAAQFETLPLEQWNRKLTPFFPHIHFVGDDLAGLIEGKLGGWQSANRFAQPRFADGIPDSVDADQAIFTRYLSFITHTRIYVFRRRLGEEGQRWLLAGLVSARSQYNRHYEAALLSDLATWHLNHGQPLVAREYLETGLTISRELGNRSDEAIALNNLMEVYRSIGQPQRSLDLCRQALPIHREVGNRGGEAMTHNNMGVAYEALGYPTQAMDAYERALPILEELGYHADVVATLSGMGRVHLSTGRVQKAAECHTRALNLARTLGDRRNEASALNNLGEVQRLTGKPVNARGFYEQALSILHKLGDRAGQAATLNNMAISLHMEGRLQEAIDLYQQSTLICRELGDPVGEATSLSNIATLYFASGQVQLARNNLEDALPIHRVTGNRLMEGATLSSLGAVYFQQGQPERAMTALREALGIFQDIGAIADEAAALLNLGLITDRVFGKTGEALDLVKRSVDLLERHGLPVDAGGQMIDQHQAILHDMQRRLQLP